MRKNLTFTELKSCLDLNQSLIDSLITEVNINQRIDTLSANGRLNKLNGRKDKIMAEIDKRLDEEFGD